MAYADYNDLMKITEQLLSGEKEPPPSLPLPIYLPLARYGSGDQWLLQGSLPPC